jgi:hypothetical protein
MVQLAIVLVMLQVMYVLQLFSLNPNADIYSTTHQHEHHTKWYYYRKRLLKKMKPNDLTYIRMLGMYFFCYLLCKQLTKFQGKEPMEQLSSPALILYRNTMLRRFRATGYLHNTYAPNGIASAHCVTVTG